MEVNIYSRRKKKGLCPQCGGIRDTPSSLCSKCKDYIRNYMRGYVNTYLDNPPPYQYLNLHNGNCPKCKRPVEDYPKYQQCSHCRSLRRKSRDRLKYELISTGVNK